jgi:hypothetical protein
MKKEILLIEPGYKNKYPPIGLMKIATYHKMLGDNVTFYKGDIKKFILNGVIEDCIVKVSEIKGDIDWRKRKKLIEKYIKTKHSKDLNELLQDVPDIFKETNSKLPLLELWFQHFADYYKGKRYMNNPKWDRVYVTTLFTFYWNITVKTIEDAKLLVKDKNELKVGGVMATLLKDEVYDETGILPLTGLLDKPGMLDDNDIIIDDLPLDYSILDEIDYVYPTGSAYFTFMTKGCTRTCAFCSVPKLEPIYKEKIPTKAKFEEITEIFGEQQNLLLMDNNVLASPKFPEIVEEIKEMGFYKGATYVEPNQLDIAIENLKCGLNDTAYIKRTNKLLRDFFNKRMKGKKNQQEFFDTLEKYKLTKLETTTKDNLIIAYPEIKETYEKYRDKSPKQRFVDFNQGTDARYVTNEYMRLMSEIPIYPLRIAFDYIGLQKQYINAVYLAHKYGIERLSNYLLFNFVDKPEDLYNRMRINVDLSKELNIHIYSFPMKYIPLYGEEAKDRHYIGKHWNKKFIRAIQSVSNATRGIVPPSESFFEKAWGKNIAEYFEILYMPETYIIYRKIFEDLGYTQRWSELFNEKLNPEEKLAAKEIIESNDFTNLSSKTKNEKILKLLSHYLISRDDVKNSDKEYQSIKKKFDKIIKSDRFVELTLTYDFE